MLRQLGLTDLYVFPLCLGGNVFGWTADEKTSFDILDTYFDAGGNFVDTADQYSAWVPGLSGGESETIIGNWLSRRSNRGKVVIATKVGKAPGALGLSSTNIKNSIEASLRRLQTDYVDLYYAHIDDEEVPLEESLGAFTELRDEGKLRHLAASNFGAARLAEALMVSDREGFVRFAGLQPHYNLLERDLYEGDLSALCGKEHLGCMPYHALANGFLTGKYRSEDHKIDSDRASAAIGYLTDGGRRVLAALDDIAAAHQTSVAVIALAWLAAQPTVTAPITSARSAEQLTELLPMANTTLSADDLALLDNVSVPQSRVCLPTAFTPPRLA